MSFLNYSLFVENIYIEIKMLHCKYMNTSYSLNTSMYYYNYNYNLL